MCSIFYMATLCRVETSPTGRLVGRGPGKVASSWRAMSTNCLLVSPGVTPEKPSLNEGGRPDGASFSG